MTPVFVITFGDIIGMVFAAFVALPFGLLFLDDWLKARERKKKSARAPQ